VQEDRAAPGGIFRRSSQAGVKHYHERLILSLLRRYGPLSRVELARRSGLSAQALSSIVGALEARGLLVAGARQKGAVGQPAIPMHLNPDGAASIGIKVGRRNAEILLMDFVGVRRQSVRLAYRYPSPDGITDFLRTGLQTIAAEMSPVLAGRLCGVGLAAPSELGSWHKEVGLPVRVAASWQRKGLVTHVQQVLRERGDAWPLMAGNDANAACAAELAFGNKRKFDDFLYVFVSTIVGGGIVLNGSLHDGCAGYAGAIGSMPVSIARDGRPYYLAQVSSICQLEKAMDNAGLDPSLLQGLDDWSSLSTFVDPWIAQAAAGIAHAILSAHSVIDFQGVIIDGALPPAVRAALVTSVAHDVASLRPEGVAVCDIVEGTIGSDARVMGAACLPMLERFYRDHEVLFSQSA